MEISTKFEDRLKIFSKSKYGKDYIFAKEWGLNRTTLSDYMRGKGKPSFESLKKLSELGCDLNWLLTGKGYDPKPSEQEVEEVKNRMLELEKELKSLMSKLL